MSGVVDTQARRVEAADRRLEVRLLDVPGAAGLRRVSACTDHLPQLDKFSSWNQGVFKAGLDSIAVITAR